MPLPALQPWPRASPGGGQGTGLEPRLREGAFHKPGSAAQSQATEKGPAPTTEAGSSPSMKSSGSSTSHFFEMGTVRLNSDLGTSGVPDCGYIKASYCKRARRCHRDKKTLLLPVQLQHRRQGRLCCCKVLRLHPGPVCPAALHQLQLTLSQAALCEQSGSWPYPSPVLRGYEGAHPQSSNPNT